jgi:hypothetical protein
VGKSKVTNEPCEYVPSLYLEVPSKDMLQGLELGKDVEVTIKGKVKGLSSSTSNYGDGPEERHTLDITDYSVKMAKSGKWEKMADEMEQDD